MSALRPTSKSEDSKTKGRFSFSNKTSVETSPEEKLGFLLTKVPGVASSLMRPSYEVDVNNGL